MELSAERPLLLVGAGNMGGALLGGWLNGSVAPAAIKIVDPQPSAEAARLAGENAMQIFSKLEHAITPQVIVFAVKPQMLDETLRALASRISEETLILSVVAGRTLAFFHAVLGPRAAIVRAMPNMAASVGAGITAAYGNKNVDAAQRHLATRLLEAVGEVVWLVKEDDIDAATAVSGSGPAYVFYLVECLAQAGIAEGLNEGIARRLARATVTGAGALLAQKKDEPRVLREAVTSPGGTTAAALKVLMGEGTSGLASLLAGAVKAARKRARELAG